MKHETLELKIKDTGFGTEGTIRIEIAADGDREKEFNELRDAIKNALYGDRQKAGGEQA